MERKDWTLLAVAAAKGVPLSPVQLQKGLFLLGQKCPNAVGRGFYRFSPYDYGPFDASIYRDAEELAEHGLITIQRATGGAWLEYKATARGLAEAARLSGQAPRTAQDYLTRVVTWARGLTFRELVRSIYHHYPQYRVNSVFQD